MSAITPPLRAAFAADLDRLDQRVAVVAAIADPVATTVGGELASCAHAILGTAALLGLESFADQARALEEEAEATELERRALVESLQRLGQRQERLTATWQQLSSAVRSTLEEAALPVAASSDGLAFTFVDDEDPPAAPTPTAFTFVDDESGTDDANERIAPVAAAPVPHVPVAAATPATTSTPADPFIAAFRDEARVLVGQADALVAGLDTAPAASAPLRHLMRIYHTLKGSANTVGLDDLGTALHDLEDRVDLLRTTADTAPLPAAAIAGLAAVQDAVRSYLAADDATNRARAVATLALARTRLAAPNAGNASPRPITVRLTATPPITERTPDTAASTPTPTPTTTTTTTAAPAATGQDVRVPVQHLDQMLELAGELVGARARLTRRLERLARIERDLGLWRRRAVPAIRRLIERSAESATAERSAPGATRGDTPDLERYDLATQLARRLEDHDDRLAGLAIDLRTLATDTAGDSTQVGDLAARLHRTTAAVRLVEPGDLVNRLHLAVKDAAHRLERQVVFHADTGTVLLDRALVDPLATALTHVVRNAVDHGIRPPAERRAAGLPDAGRITLTATAVGGAVTIQVSDDGPGLNAAAIRARATTLGLDAATPVEELIFSPGFSTRADADDVSGRGVGLDAAAEAIARIGGRITAAGTTGTGCTISLRLPPQVAVAELVLVQIGGRRCALPRAACARIAKADAAADAIALAPNLGLPAAAIGACITLELPGRTLTVGVDRVLGMSEAVVQPPGRLVSGLPLISGVVVPDDDLPIPVLDANELVRRLDAAHTLRTNATTHANAIGTGRLRVLVVDDSLAVRKVAERFLLDAGCDVALAVDGAEALELLRSGGSSFQAVISDLEMPHVDGYHLLSTLRATSATRTLPVAIMSSRRDDQHRAEAHRLGADAYLTKPFTAAQLTAFVHAAGHRT